MKPNNWLVLILCIIIIVLLYLWLRKPPAPIFNEQPLKDSLIALQKHNNDISDMNRDLLHQNDSLERVKSQTLVIYKDKLIFIGTADLHQTDSIIRKEAHL